METDNLLLKDTADPISFFWEIFCAGSVPEPLVHPRVDIEDFPCLLYKGSSLSSLKMCNNFIFLALLGITLYFITIGEISCLVSKAHFWLMKSGDSEKKK